MTLQMAYLLEAVQSFLLHLLALFIDRSSIAASIDSHIDTRRQENKTNTATTVQSTTSSTDPTSISPFFSVHMIVYSP